MVEFTITKKTLSNLKHNTITHNFKNFTKIANLKNKNLNQFILNEIPSLIYNPDKCLSRVWNKGFGKQCSRCPKNDKYCNLHNNELLTKGYLKHGNILESPPHFFKKGAI